MKTTDAARLVEWICHSRASQASNSKSEYQSRTPPGTHIAGGPLDSNIRKHAHPTGMRMSESDRQHDRKRDAAASNPMRLAGIQQNELDGLPPVRTACTRGGAQPSKSGRQPNCRLILVFHLVKERIAKALGVGIPLPGP